MQGQRASCQGHGHGQMLPSQLYCVSQKARAWVEGRCSWLAGKLGQEERGEGRKAEIGLHGCWPRKPSSGPF